jgi:hypothetical protein
MKRRVGVPAFRVVVADHGLCDVAPKRLPTNQLRRGQIIDQGLLERAAVAQPIRGRVLPTRCAVRLPSVKPGLASSPRLSAIILAARSYEPAPEGRGDGGPASDVWLASPQDCS